MANFGALFSAAKPTLQLINVSANYAEHSSCPLTWFYFLSLILLFLSKAAGQHTCWPPWRECGCVWCFISANRRHKEASASWFCGSVVTWTVTGRWSQGIQGSWGAQGCHEARKHPKSQQVGQNPRPVIGRKRGRAASCEKLFSPLELTTG